MLDEPFTSVQQANYDALSDQLAVILSSQPPCSGDGNIDGVVDIRDLVAYRALRWLSRGTSSW